ncbi:MAG: GAF domain-containing protein [Candidatus Nanopelagicales bacterium]
MTNEPNTWLLVETLGEEPTVIAEGDKMREFRRISSMYRRAAKPAIDSLISECRATKSTVSRILNKEAGQQLGAKAVAVPTVGTDGSVFAVQVWFGATAESPDTPEPVGIWDWELGLEDLPPRLLISPEFLDMYGIDAKYRDRTVYGPSDYFTRVVRVSDILDLHNKIDAATVGYSGDGTYIIRRDSGTLRKLHYAQRCVSTPAGPRLRGICRDITDIDDPARLRAELVDNTLVDTLLNLQGMFGLIGDVTYPTAPYILKWLTAHPKGIGHGVGTGQTPGIHPEDLYKVISYVNDIRNGPVTGSARIRKAGGGWMKGTFTGQLLDPEVSKTVAVGIVYPDTIDTEDE